MPHLLKAIKRSGKEKIRIFSDEKLFATDQKTNRRNARYIGIAPRRSPWSCGVKTLWSDGFMGGLKWGARDTPSLFRTWRYGHRWRVNTPPRDIGKYMDTEGHQRFTIRDSAGLGSRSYCQKDTGMVRGEPPDGGIQRLVTLQLSRFKSDGLLCLERCWIKGQWTLCGQQRHSQAQDFWDVEEYRQGGGCTCVRVLPGPSWEGHWRWGRSHWVNGWE